MSLIPVLEPFIVHGGTHDLIRSAGNRIHDFINDHPNRSNEVMDKFYKAVITVPCVITENDLILTFLFVAVILLLLRDNRHRADFLHVGSKVCLVRAAHEPDIDAAIHFLDPLVRVFVRAFKRLRAFNTIRFPIGKSAGIIILADVGIVMLLRVLADINLTVFLVDSLFPLVIICRGIHRKIRIIQIINFRRILERVFQVPGPELLFPVQLVVDSAHSGCLDSSVHISPVRVNKRRPGWKNRHHKAGSQ